MQQRLIFPMLVCLGMLVLILSGCGTNSTVSSSSTGAATVTPIVTVPLQGVPTHTPVTPTAVRGTVVVGQVTVTVNKNAYIPGEGMTVTIVNGLSSNIVAPDHQSSCTVVALQIQSNSNWQNKGVCNMGIATRMIVIRAKSSLLQTLSPGAGTIVSNTAWPKGLYRIAFSYAVNTPDASTRSTGFVTIYSKTFTIG